jgi:hypothetical protein
VIKSRFGYLYLQMYIVQVYKVNGHLSRCLVGMCGKVHVAHGERRHGCPMKHHEQYLRNWRCQHLPFTDETMCVPSHNALRRVHRKWSLTDPSIDYLGIYLIVKSSETWITAHTSMFLHYIRGITIVQSNLGLKQLLRCCIL